MRGEPVVVPSEQPTSPQASIAGHRFQYPRVVGLGAPRVVDSRRPAPDGGGSRQRELVEASLLRCPPRAR
jgi:hypothetical protein